MLAVNGNKLFLDNGILDLCAGFEMEVACLHPERRLPSESSIVVESVHCTSINSFAFFVRDCLGFEEQKYDVADGDTRFESRPQCRLSGQMFSWFSPVFPLEYIFR